MVVCVGTILNNFECVCACVCFVVEIIQIRFILIGFVCFDDDVCHFARKQCCVISMICCL